MKTIDRSEISEFEKVYRLNLINSLSGYKSANLIGTQGTSGENLAIFSSVIHLGSNPPLIGFIMRPNTVARHTLDNIRSSGVYTINHIPKSIIEKAHYTSAKFDEDESEFEACGLKAEYKDDFIAPFVKESPIKLAMQIKEEVPIELNGTILMIGEIQSVHLEEKILLADGQLDLNEAEIVSISGLNRYHLPKEIDDFPYARKEELPNFKT